MRTLALALLLSLPVLGVTPVSVGPPTFQANVLSNSTVTASGSQTYSTGSGAADIALIVNIKAAPTGTSPTLTFTVAEVDPGDLSTAFVGAQTVSGAALNSATTQVLTLASLRSNSIKVSWAVGGSAGPSFTQVFATLTAYGTTVNGTVTDSTAGATTLSSACSDANINACGANSTVSLALNGQSGVSVSFVNSTLANSTLRPDCQLGNGLWVIAPAWVDSTCVPTTSQAYVGADSTTNVRAILCPFGAQAARIRLSVLGSGNSSAFLRATTNAGSCSVYDDGAGNLKVKLASGGTISVTQTTASNLNAQVVGAAASGASKAGNPVQVGGVFNTTQPTVTTGQAVEAQATARGAVIVATGADTFNTTVNAALPTGSNVIGHVVADSGSTTAVTQATAANLNATVVAAGDAASGATNSGNPLQSGGRAASTVPTAVTDGQRVGTRHDLLGRVQVGRNDRALVVGSGVITLSASTAETTLLSSVASTFLDLFYIHCVNSSTTATRIDIRDATGGTIRDVIECPAAAGDCGGFVSGLVTIPQATVANNWTIQSSASVTDVRCVAYAEKNK
jgi:hypothetical protein